MRRPITAASEVAWFFTHADGTTSAVGTWKLSDVVNSLLHDADELGGTFFGTCLDEYVSENGGKPFSPVVAAEVVHADTVLRPWAKDPVLRAYCREYAFKGGMALVVCEVEVERAVVDVLAMEDVELEKKGYKLL